MTVVNPNSDRLWMVLKFKVIPLFSQINFCRRFSLELLAYLAKSFVTIFLLHLFLYRQILLNRPDSPTCSSDRGRSLSLFGVTVSSRPSIFLKIYISRFGSALNMAGALVYMHSRYTAVQMVGEVNESPDSTV